MKSSRLTNNKEVVVLKEEEEHPSGAEGEEESPEVEGHLSLGAEGGELLEEEGWG